MSDELKKVTEEETEQVETIVPENEDASSQTDAAASAEEEEEDGDYTVSGRGPGGGKDYRKPKDTKGTLIRLFSYILHYKWFLVAGLFCMVLGSIANLAASYQIKPLIDVYIIPNITAETKDWSGLAGRLILLACIYLVSVLTNYCQTVSMAQLSQRAVNRLRKDLFDKLEVLPIRFYDSRANGEIMSRFSNDSDSVQMAMENTVTTFVSSIISFVGTVAMMIYLSPLLFLITAVMLVICTFVVKKIGGKSKIMFKKQSKALGIVNGYVEEMVEGIKVVKAFTYEKKAKAEFNKLNDEYRQAATNANFYGMIIMPVLHNIMGFGYAITAVAGGILVLTNYVAPSFSIAGLTIGGGLFTIGSLSVFLNYTKQVAMPINMISNQIVTLLSATAGAERIFEIMDQEAEVDEGNVTLVPVNIDEQGSMTETDKANRVGNHYAWKVPQDDGSFNLVELKGDVRLNHVYFHYVEGKPVLKDVNVYAKPGQKIAFVGSTGAGKTTITNLINRFYDVQEGEILYDGIDVRDIKKDDLRHSLITILQDTHLFTDTIMENIRYGRLDATDEECIEAAKTANAYDFIMRLPEGFNTMIEDDGENLSQGQRQLLNIARAAVAKPPVLIMDEATSSIDTRTEKAIERGMDALMENCTVFVIAHRLSTVRNAHCITVIEAGQILEKGNHNELIEKQGRYYELYTGQHKLD